VAPDVGASTVWNWLHVTLLDSGVFRWLPDFWKIYAPLLMTMKILSAIPGWRFYMRASTEQIKGL
jgi:hypothetical protein